MTNADAAIMINTIRLQTLTLLHPVHLHSNDSLDVLVPFMILRLVINDIQHSCQLDIWSSRK